VCGSVDPRPRRPDSAAPVSSTLSPESLDYLPGSTAAEKRSLAKWYAAARAALARNRPLTTATTPASFRRPASDLSASEAAALRSVGAFKNETPIEADNDPLIRSQAQYMALLESHWNQFRTFGPTAARWDHHLPNAHGGGVEQKRSVCCCAQDVDMCAAEIFQSTRRIDRTRNAPGLVVFALREAVTLRRYVGRSSATNSVAPLLWAALRNLGIRRAPGGDARAPSAAVGGGASLRWQAGDRNAARSWKEQGA
jgi:hypothetical protein